MRKNVFTILLLFLSLSLNFITAKTIDLTEELEELTEQIKKLDQNLGYAKLEVEHLGRRPHIYGEFAGTINFTNNSSVGHHVFNAARLAYSPDANTNAVMMLNLRNGLGGTTSGNDANVAIAEFNLRTRVLWGNQNYNLTLGNYFFSASPFTIQRATHLKDRSVENRENFTGLLIEGRLLSMPFVGMLSPLRSGEGVGYDRFLEYARFQTNIKEAALTLAYLRVFDDLSSNHNTSRAYSSSILSSQLNHEGVFLGNWVTVEGELAISKKEHDLWQGPIAKNGSAVRLDAETYDFSLLRTRIPLNLSLYRITKDYPLDYNTIRQLPSDFIYQEEDNPRIPDFFLNVGYGALEFGPVRKLLVGVPTSTIGQLKYARELESSPKTNRSFVFSGLSTEVELDLRSVLTLSVSDYLTLRPDPQKGEYRHKQTVYDGNIRRNFTGFAFALGYKNYAYQENNADVVTKWNLQEPYLKFDLETKVGTLEVIHKRQLEKQQAKGWKNEIKFRGRASDGVGLRVEYLSETFGAVQNRDLYFSYNVVY